MRRKEAAAREEVEVGEAAREEGQRGERVAQCLEPSLVFFSGLAGLGAQCLEPHSVSS